MATTENLHEGDGTRINFSFTFPYQKQSDIEVYVFETNDWVKKTITTQYKFADATHIEFLSGSIPADVAAGSTVEALLGGTQNVKIKRNTPTDKLIATFYPGSAIRSSDLNDNFTQNLYVTEEADEASTITNKTVEALVGVTNDEGTTYVTQGDGVGSNPKGVKYAVTIADTAKTTAEGAETTANDAETLVHTYVHDGTNLKGSGIDGQPQGVKYAVDTAVEADNIADGAKVDADKAKLATDRLVATTSDGGSTWTLAGGNTNASTDPKGVKYAVEKTDDAVADATTALNNSQDLSLAPGNTSAIDIAKDAKTTATDADNIADAAKLATDTYVHDGTSVKGDGIGSNPKGVAYAVTTAEAAQSAISNSTTYNLKSNKTDFEAVTFTAEVDGQPSHKAWEISNSTGITSSYTGFTDNAGSGTAKTVTGVPTDFVGDSGLSARFNYTHSTNTFAWAGYWVNDAEDRYGGSITQNLREITTNYTLKDTMNGFSIGPITIASGATITIPANSKYVVMN